MISDDLNERLTLVSEECAEVIQAICKIQRFGYEANPETGESKKAQLEKEIGQLNLAINMLFAAGDVDRYEVLRNYNLKYTSINQFLNYNEV